MALTTRTYDEEFLVRFNAQGIQGMHVIAVEEILDDQTGAVLTGRRLEPRAVSSADSAQLQSIGAKINDAALASINGLTSERDAAIQAKADAEKDRDSALSQVSELKARIAILSAPEPGSGAAYVKKWQLNAGLRADGIYDAVTAYINGLPPSAKDLWNGSAGVERNSPFIEGFKAQFGKSDADVDAMFARYSHITQADVLLLAEQEAQADTSGSGVMAWFKKLFGG